MFLSAVNLGIFIWLSAGNDWLLESASIGHSRNFDFSARLQSFHFSTLEVATFSNDAFVPSPLGS